MFDTAIFQVFSYIFAPSGNPNIIVRFFNLKESINMRSLDPKDIDTLISVKGMVIRTR